MSGGATAAIPDAMMLARPIRSSVAHKRGVRRGAGKILISLLMFLAVGAVGTHAQSETPIETELLATRRVMPAVGPGLRGVCRGPGGNYYVLSAPGDTVLIYDAAGKRVGQVPAEPVGAAAIVYGESLSVDDSGRVAVADRGASGVKIYAPDGSLAVFVRVASPESVAFLGGGELAVASVSGKHLVAVYDITGRLLREFGDPTDVAEQSEQPLPVQQASMGLIATDASSDVYFAFDFLPAVTVLKYDRLGYALFDISSKIAEFGLAPPTAAQTEKDEIARIQGGGSIAPHRVITGLGVNPKNQDLWVSAGTLLLHFDKEGDRVASYHTYTPSGGRLEVTTILVESDRLLLGADPFGLYEFALPDEVTH
ncbi:MAG: hypothetical protein WBE97_10660 [Candidatus Acidiferrales bacterium]